MKNHHHAARPGLTAPMSARRGDVERAGRAPPDARRPAPDDAAVLTAAAETGADVHVESPAERLPIPAGHALAVIGAVNLHPEDRTLPPGRVRCVQLLLAGHTIHCA